MEASARDFLAERAKQYETLLEGEFPDQLEALVRSALSCLRAGGKLLLFGNGGSAALAQHLAGELVGRFLRDRRPLPALSLTAETSALTAIGNDYAFEQIFSRQIEAHGRPGDLAVGLSTSGRSANVVRALGQARANGLRTSVLTGGDGGDAARAAEIAVVVPSRETDLIQEVHGAAAHYLCHRIDAEFAGAKKA